MRRGGGQSDHIEDGAAAHRDNVGMAIDMITIDVRMNLRNVEIGILGAFTSFDNKRRTDQF